jgi:hypothetical protein
MNIGKLLILEGVVWRDIELIKKPYLSHSIS